VIACSSVDRLRAYDDNKWYQSEVRRLRIVDLEEINRKKSRSRGTQRIVVDEIGRFFRQSPWKIKVEVWRFEE
jgi:hypothetical protein